ncbi:hypothetical protein EYF80_048615 [Liparis tanakae]|uniref:Uncharacterized protein n=1 Tax=Liparis tanakae TaxID=230148 RepID=A0A4Z2FJX3_9TELE|nr:hypothetical protein EYF80_048615 [Liparis tanakae]
MNLPQVYVFPERFGNEANPSASGKLVPACWQQQQRARFTPEPHLHSQAGVPACSAYTWQTAQRLAEEDLYPHYLKPPLKIGSLLLSRQTLTLFYVCIGSDRRSQGQTHIAGRLSMPHQGHLWLFFLVSEIGFVM